MRIGFAHIAAMAIILAGSISADGGMVVPLGGAPNSLDYEIMYRLGVEAQDFSLIPSTGPFSITTSYNILGDIHTPNLTFFDLDANGRANIFAQITERYVTTRDAKGNDLPWLVGGFAYRPSNCFSAISYFRLDRAKALDPDYDGKKYRGLAGDLETSLLIFHKNNLNAAFGRSRVFWGPRRVNLVLSETSEPLDLLAAGYSQGRFSFSFIFAQLDRSRPEAADSANFPGATFNDNRYLAAHRVDVRINRHFRLGFFETVLFGGEGRSPELYYLNPLQVFHSAQLNEDRNDNTTLGVDFTALVGKGISAYGQLLVDDFQVDNASRGDNEPNELGLLAGIFKAGKVETIVPDITLEYVRITNRTYHQREPRNRYVFRNKLIGHPLGPDADSVAVTFRFWPNKLFYAEIELAYRRHGEGSIYKSWDEPWMLVDDYSESFPTGIVEESKLLAVRAAGYIPISGYTKNHLFISLDAGLGDIKNYHNLDGLKKTTGYFDFSLTWMGCVKFNQLR